MRGPDTYLRQTFGLTSRSNSRDSNISNSSNNNNNTPLYNRGNHEYTRYNKSDFNFQLFISLLAIYLSSLMMFSLTGMYTQSSFNLGNRVTIYFCIFLGYILILIKNKNVLIFIVSLILVFPSISISQHWKQWNSKQIIINCYLSNQSILHKKKMLSLHNVRMLILIVFKLLL